MQGVEPGRYSDTELVTEFDRLFPQGFSGEDVLRELAPAGWENSPLLAVNHPSVAQLYDEAVRLHRNLCDLRRSDDERPLPPEPTLNEIAQGFREHPVDAQLEVRELVGQCLWDIFSDNHEVIAADERVLDLGSFRASGEFLADYLNRQSDTDRYDYMNFYMGTCWFAQLRGPDAGLPDDLRPAPQPGTRLGVPLSEVTRDRHAAAQRNVGAKG